MRLWPFPRRTHQKCRACRRIEPISYEQLRAAMERAARRLHDSDNDEPEEAS